jgi:hypothetical protein
LTIGVAVRAGRDDENHGGDGEESTNSDLLLQLTNPHFRGFPSLASASAELASPDVDSPVSNIVPETTSVWITAL